MSHEAPEFSIKEESVLEKFEGDAHPDNLVERVYLVDGVVVQHDFIKDGEVVATFDSYQQ